MNIVLDPIRSGDVPVLRNLWELYAHDFSEFAPRDLGSDGRFESDDEFARMTAAPLELYWIRVAGRVGGFVFIRPYSHITGASTVSDVAQFFVLRGYRRTGVGQTAARLAFARRPGRWEVRVIDANRQARAFWRRAIAAAGGDSEEQPWEQGVVYRFEV